MLVVYYHNIITTALDEFDKRLSRIHVDDFTSQIQYLSEHYNLISLEMMLSQLKEGTDDPKALVITFDDGYYGVMAHALPVLQSFNISATAFVVTDFARPLEEFRLFHFDEIEVAFRLTVKPGLNLESEGEGVCPLGSIKARVDCMKRIKKRLKMLPDLERQRLQRLILERLEVSSEEARSFASSEEKYRTMSWDEVRAAMSAGLSIGSHTCTHRVLSQLDRNEIEDEIFRSFSELQKELRLDAIPFAYPYGGPEHIGPDTPAMVEQAGYSCALTTIPGRNDPTRNPFRLRRFEFNELQWLW